MQFRVSLANLPEFLGSIDAHAKQVRYALAVALTRTASFVRDAENFDTSRVFNAPVARTQKAVEITSATKATLAAEVDVKYDASGIAPQKYLRAEVLGGARKQKRSELALMRAFPFLGSGYWVPGPGVRLDGYGNVSGSTIVRILADVQAFNEVGYLANRTKRSVKRNASYRGARYFVPPAGSPLDKRARGVWVRKGRAVLPALIWVRSATYKPRFDFYGRGEALTVGRFPVELEASLTNAFATAR